MSNSIRQLTEDEQADVLHLNLSSTSKTKIHRIEGLERFTRLTTLVLNNHMIAKLENLSHLKSLKVLNLEFNQIKVLESLDELSCLEELYLSYNSIRSVRQKLELLPCLRILHLAYNELAIEHISSLAAATSLTILSLHGNPLTKQITYHTLIGLVFSKLVILDEKEVRRVEVDIVTEQVSFLRGALNQVIKQKNEIIAEATKIKRELTNQSEHPHKSHLSQQQQENLSYNQEKQQKLFYVQALHEQNRILDQKISKTQEAISGFKQKQKSINHYQSVRLAQQLQQQNTFEHLSSQLQSKYTETLKLERRLQKMQRENCSRQEKEKVLNQLINNETIINKYHQQLEAIKRDSQEHSIEQQAVEESCGETSVVQDQLVQLENQLEKYKQKMSENIFLIRQYRESLQSSRRSQSSMYHQLVFGECGNQFNIEDVIDFTEKYPAGLLPTIAELFTITFGKYVPIQTIKELAKRLKDTPLIKFMIHEKQKTESLKEKKNKTDLKQKAFLEEKYTFIKEFQRETKELTQQWTTLKQEKRLFEEEMELKRITFYEQLQGKMKVEQCRLKQKKEQFILEEQKHQRAISELARNEINKKQQLDQIHLQVKQVAKQFEIKFKQLQEFEKHFSELKAQKHNLNKYHNEIERMKKLTQRLTEQINQKEKIISDMETQEELLNDRIECLEDKAKERLNSMLEIDTKFKEINQKLSKSVAEHNQIIERIQTKENQLRVLQDETKDYERNMERAKVNFNTWEDKLANLQALQVGKKEAINDIESHMNQLDEAVKARLRINEDLQLKRDRLMEEANAYQLKVMESKTSLDSLTSLNNAISKMSLHHRELKATLMELQIVYEAKLKERICLEQNIEQLALEETGLLSRITKLKNV